MYLLQVVMQEHFWHLDQDKDGKLGLQDVQQALATGCIRIPPEEDVIAIFNAADITHTSRLDFANFAAVMVEKHHYARSVLDLMCVLMQQHASLVRWTIERAVV